MDSTIKVIDTLSPALAKYASLQTANGKTEIEAMEKIMMYIIDFAANKIPKGNREKMMSLMTRVMPNRWKNKNSTKPAIKIMRRGREQIGEGKRGGRGAINTANKWRNTYAARLVWLSNYKEARSMPAEQFYKTVALFVNRRIFSLNLHRSGLYPAMKRLKSKRRNAGKPDYKQGQPGKYEQSIKQGVATMMAENWASARSKGSKGIVGLKGDAFDLALPQVEKMLTDWYNADMKKFGAAAGLKVKT